MANQKQAAAAHQTTAIHHTLNIEDMQSRVDTVIETLDGVTSDTVTALMDACTTNPYATRVLLSDVWSHLTDAARQNLNDAAEAEHQLWATI
tara:strand:+ start:250 stop:525 length:276 start_codon:yes stop_codon:yes gene_type:complete